MKHQSRKMALRERKEDLIRKIKETKIEEREIEEREIEERKIEEREIEERKAKMKLDRLRKIGEIEEKEIVEREAKKEENLIEILNRQKIDGHWEEKSEFFDLLKLNPIEIFKKKPQELTKEAWLTIIVLACLEKRFAKECGTWVLIAQKAKEYLEDNDVPYSQYMLEAYEMFK